METKETLIKGALNNTEAALNQAEIAISRRKRKERIINFPVEFGNLEGLLTLCQSSDWKVRMEKINEVYEICDQYPEEAMQHRHSGKIIDVFSKQISDPNVKVSLNSLKLLINLTSRLYPLMQSNIGVILNELFNCFASNKIEIRSLSDDLYCEIETHVERGILVQYLCNSSIYGLQKARPTILSKLAGIIKYVKVHK